MKFFVKEHDLRAGRVIFDHLHLMNNHLKNKNTDPARLKIISRAVKEVRNGMNINLGIGIPTLLPAVLPKDIQINMES